MTKPRGNVTLREITQDTLFPVLALAVAPEQERLVSSNARSIAEAYFEPGAWFRAIDAEGEPVGFLMLYDGEASPAATPPGFYYLWRFMIDQRHQHRGIGRAAIELLVEHVKTRPKALRLLVSCHEGEGSPQGFYERCGFTLTGTRNDSGEIELERPLV